MKTINTPLLAESYGMKLVSLDQATSSELRWSHWMRLGLAEPARRIVDLVERSDAVRNGVEIRSAKRELRQLVLERCELTHMHEGGDYSWRLIRGQRSEGAGKIFDHLDAAKIPYHLAFGSRVLISQPYKQRAHYSEVPDWLKHSARWLDSIGLSLQVSSLPCWWYPEQCFLLWITKSGGPAEKHLAEMEARWAY